MKEDVEPFVSLKNERDDAQENLSNVDAGIQVSLVPVKMVKGHVDYAPYYKEIWISGINANVLKEVRFDVKTENLRYNFGTDSVVLLVENGIYKNEAGKEDYLKAF